MSPCKFIKIQVYISISTVQIFCLLLKSPQINRLIGTLHGIEVSHKPQESCDAIPHENTVRSIFFKTATGFKGITLLYFKMYSEILLREKACGNSSNLGMESVSVNAKATMSLWSCVGWRARTMIISFGFLGKLSAVSISGIMSCPAFC